MFRNWWLERVSSAGDWWRTARAMAVTAFSAVALLCPAAANAAADDCIEMGGQAVCTAPQVEAWGYGLCDEVGAFVARYPAKVINLSLGTMANCGETYQGAVSAARENLTSDKPQYA